MQRGVAYLYLLPALLVLGVFTFWPLLHTVWISFNDWNLVSGEHHLVGLKNYQALLADPAFRQTLLQSGAYLLLGLLGNGLLPLGVALLTLQVSERESEFYQSLLFLPTVVAVSVGTLIWLWFYLPAGGLFGKLWQGITHCSPACSSPNWLGDPRTALGSVALVGAWKFFGFNYLIALAGLRAIPKDVLEAARVDGAAGWNLLSRIILPLFAPTGLFLLVSAALSSLENTFVPVDVLTAGGPSGKTSHLMYAVYQDAFRFFRAGRAAAEAVLLIVLFGGLVLWQLRAFRENHD